MPTQFASTIPLVTGEPIVRLMAYTEDPYDLALASARTCYSPNLRTVEEVNDKLRENMGKALFNAGHHTPFQHPTFIFGLENVSRQFVWSFLHSHPFYNSEQSSQRYNLVTEAKVFVPPLAAHHKRLYEQATLQAWENYRRIYEILVADYRGLMTNLGRKKGQSDKGIESDAQKKSMETARYVLPIGAFTSLYHTVSGIELQRYLRMMNTGDCPAETRVVVQKMVDAVKAVDPNFFTVSQGPMPEELTLEAKLAQSKQPTQAQIEAENRKFDSQLDGRFAKLVSFDPNAEGMVADGVREVLGTPEALLSDDEALELLMHPGKNPYLLDTLNTWTHSPLMRALNHAQYTFKKKISHTADSQDQRHRMTPGSRPLLTRVHTEKPDYILPEVLKDNTEAVNAYRDTMDILWDAKNALIADGVSTENATYLLPNAVSVRFTQSGSMLNFMHKWRLRTCFLAQWEIYQSSMDELAQVAAVHPRLTQHQGPPCLVRDGLVTNKTPEGPCPEGGHWCGVDVWRNFPKVKRPF